MSFGLDFSLSLGLSIGFCLRVRLDIGLGFILGLSLSNDLVLVSITYKTKTVTNQVQIFHPNIFPRYKYSGKEWAVAGKAEPQMPPR